MQKLHKQLTSRRLYFVTNELGLFYANFQPLNPKTGQPWQADRRINSKPTHNAHVYFNAYGDKPNSGKTSDVFEGKGPATIPGWDYVITGHKTLDDAVVAIEAKIKKDDK